MNVHGKARRKRHRVSSSYWEEALARCMFEPEKDKKDSRQWDILKTVNRHIPYNLSPEKFSEQYERQISRLDPGKRWHRKNMKGYHLREVIVD